MMMPILYDTEGVQLTINPTCEQKLKPRYHTNLKNLVSSLSILFLFFFLRKKIVGIFKTT